MVQDATALTGSVEFRGDPESSYDVLAADIEAGGVVTLITAFFDEGNCLGIAWLFGDRCGMLLLLASATRDAGGWKSLHPNADSA